MAKTVRSKSLQTAVDSATARRPPQTAQATACSTFGAAVIGFGVQHCMYGHFRPGMPPFPASLTQQSWPAYLAGAALISLGGWLVVGRHKRTAGVITALFLLVAACTHLSHIHAVLVNGDARTGMVEVLALAASASAFGSTGINVARQRGYFRAAKVIFCLSMFVFGVQHFLYLHLWLLWYRNGSHFPESGRYSPVLALSLPRSASFREC